MAPTLNKWRLGRTNVTEFCPPYLTGPPRQFCNSCSFQFGASLPQAWHDDDDGTAAATGTTKTTTTTTTTTTIIIIIIIIINIYFLGYTVVHAVSPRPLTADA